MVALNISEASGLFLPKSPIELKVKRSGLMVPKCHLFLQHFWLDPALSLHALEESLDSKILRVGYGSIEGE